MKCPWNAMNGMKKESAHLVVQGKTWTFAKRIKFLKVWIRCVLVCYIYAIGLYFYLNYFAIIMLLRIICKCFIFLGILPTIYTRFYRFFFLYSEFRFVSGSVQQIYGLVQKYTRHKSKMAASLFRSFFVHYAHRNSGRSFSWKLHYPRRNTLYTKNNTYFKSGVSPNGEKSEKLLRRSFLSWTNERPYRQLTKKIHSYKCKL